jgi:hypothetical protein
MTHRAATVFIVVGAILSSIPAAFSQSAFRWSVSPEWIQKLTGGVSLGPKISFPISREPDLAMIAKGRHLANAGQQISPPLPLQPGKSATLLSTAPVTLLSTGSPGAGGPSRVQSAKPANQASFGSMSANEASPAHTVATGSSTAKLGVLPGPLHCLTASVSDVNGDNGITSLIFLEPGKNYVIHGCGFGTEPGQVYLTGVKHEATSKGSVLRFREQHPDWIPLLPTTGADPHQPQAWTDTEIQIEVDPNVGGFFDNFWSAAVLVIPSGGKPQIQSVDGFGFWAARAEQTLSSIDLPANSGPVNLKQPNNGPILADAPSTSFFTPARVNDSGGATVLANLLSPSAASLVLPGHTFAVVRDDNGAGFVGNHDTLVMEPSVLNLHEGFQVSNLQLFTASLSPAMCPSGSTFSSNGNWSSASTGQDSVSVSWQEQSCGMGGISAYAMDVTVIGPRGVSPM